MDLNLDALKRDIVQFLEASEFALFHSEPGGLEGLPIVSWDTERYPDYQMFLDAARKVGAKMILFASRDFELEEVEDAVEQMEDCDLTRDERREMERRLHEFLSKEGVTCSLEIAFDYDARMYVYEAHPDWYDEFLELCDELSAHLPLEEQEDGPDDGLGGFYSNN